MSIETEKKYRLTTDRQASIVESLNEFSAEYEGEDFEVNTIYGSEFLTQNGGVLRIRKIHDRSLITFKRPVEGVSGAKHQLEYETEVADAGSMAEIIRELGLTPRIVYEKRRRTWKFRKTEVVLDELPFGLFMEIEGSLTAIREAEMLLDIEDLEVESLTYPRLTALLGTDRRGIIEARFDTGSTAADN